MTAVLNPATLTAMQEGVLMHSGEDGLIYLLTDAGEAIPLQDPIGLTSLDSAQLTAMGGDWLVTTSSGELAVLEPAAPRVIGDNLWEGQVRALAAPLAGSPICAAAIRNATSAPRLSPGLRLNLLSGTLDPRITFTRASTATRVNGAGLIESVAVDAPRFDHDPVTLAPRGLLSEEARTNLLSYSNDFSNAAWTKNNITLGAATTGPDGLASLVKVEATSSTSTLLSRSVSSAGSASGNAFSVYAKKGSGATDANRFCLRNSTTATDLIIVSINYDTGALTYSLGTGPATAVNVGNGTWRIPLAATTGISAGNNLAVHVCFIGGSETAGEYAYAGFTQLEAGSFATSYIPTAGAPVIRAAESVSVNTSGLPADLDWYTETAEGTMKSELHSAATRKITLSRTTAHRAYGSGVPYEPANKKYMIAELPGTTISNLRCYTGGPVTSLTFIGSNGVTVTKDLSANADSSFSLASDGLTGPVRVIWPDGLSSNTALQVFLCYSNQLTGSIPSLSANTALTHFYCNNNQLTGSIPSLATNTALQIFYCQINQLTGSIPSLSANTALQQFHCANNQLTGSIPSLSSNTALQVFYCFFNQLTGWAGGTISAALGDFRVYNNNLPQATVDALLAAFVAAGRTSASGTCILNIGGAGNAAPSAAGLADKATLQGRGWTVTTN